MVPRIQASSPHRAVAFTGYKNGHRVLAVARRRGSAKPPSPRASTSRTARLACLDRDVGVGVGTLALFFGFWLSATQPLREPAAPGVRMQPSARYDSLVAALGRQLNQGGSYEQKIPQDVMDKTSGD